MTGWGTPIPPALALAALLTAAPASPQEAAQAPVLVTYGLDAPASEGDPDKRQEIEIALPAGGGTHFLRVFDPASGTDRDTIFGIARDTRTRFTLFGGEGADAGDAPLAAAEFGPEDGAGTWVTLAEIRAAQGQEQDGTRRFTLVVEGVAGDDGNVYGVVAADEPDGISMASGVAFSTTEATVSIPRRDIALEFAFDAPEGAEAIIVETFDVTGGEVVFTGPFRSVPLPSSPQGAWRAAEVALMPEEDGARLAVTIAGGEETPNEVALRVFALIGEDREAVPLSLPPRELLPNGRPTARIESRALDCRRVELDAGRSTDPEAEALAFLWRFEDGSTATGRRVVRDFKVPGRYGVRLEARDPGARIGNGAATEAEIVVKDRPSAVIGDIPAVVGLGETVTFDGTGSAAMGEEVSIERHEWLVTDGTILQGETAEHRFDVPGRYGVRLLVQDDSGHPCRSAAAQAVVTVNAAPRAVAGPDLRVAAGEPFTLDGRASGDPDGEIARYAWTITPAEGAAEAGAEPVARLDGAEARHALAAPGLYRVTLSVDDGTGVGNATDTDALILEVNAAPIAEAGPDFEVALGELAPLDASASRDPDGRIESYAWDLGNGDLIAGRVPTYAFQRLGVYRATLTVMDDSGLANATATDSVTITVVPPPNAPPLAEAGPERHAMVGEPVLFDGGASQDPDGNLIGYAWEFGDGHQGEGLVTRHAYRAEGTYTARLTVTDDSGLTNATAEDTARIHVRPRPNMAPIADAGPDRAAVVGERVVFDATASRDPDGAILGYFWDLGDGARARGPTIAHVWRRPGIFEVTLEVEDDGPRGDGRSTDRLTVTVTPAPNEAPVAMAGPDRVVAFGEAAALDGSASADPDGNLIAWTWTLGDGRIASGPRVEHRYDAPGVYTARLVVQDASGRPNDQATDTVEITVNASPVAEAGRDRAVAVGDTVRLDARRSRDPDGEIIRHDWQVLDAAGQEAARATGPEADIALDAPGRYRVVLTVEDDADVANSSAEDMFALTVNAAPVADAGPDLAVRMGEPVPFDAARSHDPDGRLVSHAWDFGNGDRGQGATPIYAYHEPGDYTVTLAVTDDSGLPNAVATDAITVSVRAAENQGPIAEAGPDISAIVGERLIFDGSASRDADGDVLTHVWEFGDGRTARGAGPAHAYWQPGTYEVTLTVTDGSGAPNASATDRLSVRVSPRPNVPPVARAGGDVTARVEERIVFDANASEDPDGTILNFTWAFGDGAEATGPRALYVYRAPGTYEATLTVSDDGSEGGAEATDRFTVTILPTPGWTSSASAPDNDDEAAE